MTIDETDKRAPSIDADWFTRAFDQLYPVVYAHRTVEAATRESTFAIEQLQLSPSGAVLDLCCGNGRHMVHLLRHTPHVVGLDYSRDLLGFAREQLGGQGRLLRGDMRAIPFCGSFDAVANFFTSFGYFEAEEENLAVARGIAGALKPKGRFFMDYLNPDYVRNNLKPSTQRSLQGYEIAERRWVDEVSGRVNKVTEVHRDGVLVNKSSESVKLYTSEVLESLLREAGLHIEACYGDYDGSSVSEERPRQIVVGRRE